VEFGGETLLVAIVQETSEREAMLRDIVKQERAGAVATLAEGVAHEFNNLLARILACAEEGSELAIDLTVRRDLSTIIQAAEEGGRIAEHLLSYARRRPIELRPVSLVSIIEHTLQIMEDDLSAAKVHVLRDFEPLPTMMLDNGQIGQVFVNLISNARDAMSDGGALHVSVRRAGDEAVVHVTDTGPGIPSEILADLFKPFVTTKGPRGRSVVPGMGLGLCVCDGILASHGGSISVSSEPGKGTTFTVRLPIGSLGKIRDEGGAGETPKR
jgi:signal transduction histidine kinase